VPVPGHKREVVKNVVGCDKSAPELVETGRHIYGGFAQDLATLLKNLAAVLRRRFSYHKYHLAATYVAVIANHVKIEHILIHVLQHEYEMLA
jgi:hypothetical protein